MAALVLVAYGAFASRFVIAIGVWLLAIALFYGSAAPGCEAPYAPAALLVPAAITATLAFAALSVGRALRWLWPSLAAR